MVDSLGLYLALLRSGDTLNVTSLPLFTLQFTRPLPLGTSLLLSFAGLLFKLDRYGFL